jgi:hypothetical protein
MAEDFDEIWQRLKREWNATREVWLDTTAEEFDMQYWQITETEIRAVMQELERLRVVLRRKS